MIMRLLIILCTTLISTFGSAHPNTFDIEQWQTPKGTRVIFYPTRTVPMLDITIAFAAGSAYDGKHFGLSALTTRLLNQGNGRLNANEMAERLADTGAQFSSDTTRTLVTLNLRTLTQPQVLDKSLELFSLILQPNFNKQAFAREQKQQLLAIRQAQESPDEVANETFIQALYATHPYAHATNGDALHVNQLKLHQVRQFYQRYFTAQNAVVVLVGDISRTHAHELANKLTQNLPQGQAAPVIPKAQNLEKAKEQHIEFVSSQTMLRLGQLGIDYHDPDYFPLLVGNHILGGNALNSRLSTEIREKRGLTYGVYSQFIPMPALGPYVIGLSTKTNQTQNARNIMTQTLNMFVTKGPSEKELDAAKRYLIGSFPIGLASNSGLADSLLKIVMYHLPNDYLNTYAKRINQVTTQDIQHAFQRHIDLNRLLFVSVGKS